MKGVVIDCSITLAWLFEDERSPEIDTLLRSWQQGTLIVPSLWHIEVANAVVTAEKRGRLAPNTIPALLELVTDLPVETDEETVIHALHETLQHARKMKLTAYDAVYLELALRRNLPLATRDEALRAAAVKIGIDVIP